MITFRHIANSTKVNFKNRSKSTQLYLQQFSYIFFIRLGSIIISLIYVPVVLGYLSSERYGVWIALSTIINWMRLFDIGIGNGLRNKLTSAIATNNRDEGVQLVSTAYFTLGLIFIGLIAILLFFNNHIPWSILLNTTLVTQKELLTLSNIVISFVLLGFVLQLVGTIYDAHGKSSIPNLIQLIISTFSLSLIYLATLFTEKENIILISLILSGSPVLLNLVFSFYTFLVKYPYLCPKWKYFKLKNSSGLFRLSGQFFVVQMTATILFASIPFVVTQFYGPEKVTLFQIASSIFNLPILLIGLITAPVTPYVTSAYSRNEYLWIKNMLKKMHLASILIVGLTVLMIVLSPRIYQMWLGNSVNIPKSLSLAVGLYAIIQVIVTPFSIFLNAIGKIKILVILAPLGIITFIGGCFVLNYLIQDVYSISLALSLSSLIGLFAIPPVIKKALRKNE